MLKLIILGPPGAGKGTQAIKLAKTYRIPHISTGDILRDNINRGTNLGEQASGFIKRGELVPDNLITKIILEKLDGEECNLGYILDGFPRTIWQAKKLDDYFRRIKQNSAFVINIKVDDNILVDRITGRRTCQKCGATYHIINLPPKFENKCNICRGNLVQRPDDKINVIVNRLEVFKLQIKKLEEFYSISPNYQIFDGSEEPNNLTKKIAKYLCCSE